MPLFCIIHNHRRWGRVVLAGQWVVIGWVKEGHVLDSVVLYCSGKIDLVSIWRYNLSDAVRANPAVVQLPAWPLGSDILGIEPHPIANAKCWGWCSSPIRLLLVSVLGPEYLRL